MDSTQTLSTEQVSIDVGDMTDTDQFLTFMLAGEEYGVDILRVQEIKGWDAVTTIPNTPEYLRGVINLRGTIIPIIDMRIRFGLEKLDYGALTVVIVLKVDSDEKNRVIGIVVDGVSDVYNVPEEEIKPSPDFGSAVDTEFVQGLATIDEKMVIILDIDQMFNSGDLEIMDSCIDE
ncbi:MAG TPA: chemotaxis protein CheW [Gammaproteobacteria bacterium]|nr:chemotaxis protein CheW [Gammaproteobacteria bacterium]